MPRRREVPKREILPDPKFNSSELTKFVNVIMLDGKKAVAERIVYGALDQIAKKSGKDPLEVFTLAINNVKQMGYLSAYYAHKIRGATYKKAGEKDKARAEMANAYCWWMAYSRSMEATYLPDSFRNLAIAPDWKYADAAVLKEYTDLGGVGVPDCSGVR